MKESDGVGDERAWGNILACPRGFLITHFRPAPNTGKFWVWPFFGSPARLDGPKLLTTPVRRPRRPVMRPARLGVHTLAATWKSVNRTPLSAIASRFGVSPCQQHYVMIKRQWRGKNLYFCIMLQNIITLVAGQLAPRSPQPLPPYQVYFVWSYVRKSKREVHKHTFLHVKYLVLNMQQKVTKQKCKRRQTRKCDKQTTKEIRTSRLQKSQQS